MWIDINPHKTGRLIELSPPKELEIEVRLVVWTCAGQPGMDLQEGKNDLFVTGMIGNDKQSTDVHMFSMNGIGNFNWRMVWKLLVDPTRDTWPVLQIRTWDQDFGIAKEDICFVNLNLKVPCQKVMRTKEPWKKKRFTVEMKPSRKSKSHEKNDYSYLYGVNDTERKIKVEAPAIDWWRCFIHCMLFMSWVCCPCCTDEEPTADKPKILLTLEVLPYDMANEQKVGKGRNHPNIDPYLEKPGGRFKPSLYNPIQTLKQMISPKYCRMLGCIICTIISAALAIMMLPNLASNIITKILLG